MTRISLKISYIFYFIFSAVVIAQAALPLDIRKLSSTANADIYEFDMQNFRMETVTIAGKVYQKPVFDNATLGDDPATFLPGRTLLFGLPSQGGIQISILSSGTQQFYNKRIAQLPDPYGDTMSQATNQKYPQLADYHQPVTSIGTAGQFRDIRTMGVTLNPFAYNAQNQTLTVMTKIRFKITYTGNYANQKPFRLRGKLDKLYASMLLNFKRAQHWQVSSNRLLKQATVPGDGPFYLFDVNKDGLYKITPAVMTAAGIALNNTPIDEICIYNNGGHQLSFATTATTYNPPFSQQIATYAHDSNNNGLFDDGDYLLFYAKGVNSYFYDAASKKFTFQEHPFDDTNRFALTVGLSQRQAMTLSPVAGNEGATEQDYGTQRFHYENDLYNLLNSGPDWYGLRFFGSSMTRSIDFELPHTPVSETSSAFTIRLKGGTGIGYQDPSYAYRWTVNVNTSNVLNSNRFTGSSVVAYNQNLPAGAVNKGANSVSIQFTGLDLRNASSEASVAYLDWFDLNYDATNQAANDYFSFFTKSADHTIRYSLAGFGTSSDIIALDVTIPTSPKIILENASSANLQIALPASDPREIISARLGSSAIKEITSLKAYSPRTNLTATDNQADYLIITRNSLLDYGRQIGQLRKNLISKAVSMEDIYLYFNSGVHDPTAIRNFIRYAYNNWQGPALSYILLLGDGHYDYRHINLSDSIVVPVFEVFSTVELDSREVDHYFAQLETSDNSSSQRKIRPSIALGRIPVENAQDAQVALQKLKVYDENPHKDGWQIQMTFVADDTVKTFGSESWLHQPQTETLIKTSNINKYLEKKIYLSAYKSVPGGRRVLKPGATRDLLDQINNGTLLLNFVGHGSPTTWADETVFNFERDYAEINNSGKYTFLVAATCDFGEFDDPNKTSFTEALIWKPDAGIIGGLVSTRLVYSWLNSIFNRYFFSKLFPTNGRSAVVGDAFIQALHVSDGSNVNDQKFHLLADPTMRLADPDLPMEIKSVKPDTLKALSTVEVKADITDGNSQNSSFNGGAILVVNDAMYEHVNTGGGPGRDYNLLGPLVFRGEVSVEAGSMTGHFIVPKSIRYKNSKTGRVTIYAWDETSNQTATGYLDNLLFLGSSSATPETDGPAMDIFFDGQESFTSGDIIAGQPTLLVHLQDESGINVTGQLGHKIQLTIDDKTEIDISPFFQYDRDSFTSGQVRYAIAGLKKGDHRLKVTAFDNLNNTAVSEVNFVLEDNQSLHLERVVNYPNPFSGSTAFTFQTNRDGADVTVKIYTINGRLIREINGAVTQTGFNKLEWDGLDDDGDAIANGVYLYKVLLSDGTSKSEKIEKLVKVQ